MRALKITNITIKSCIIKLIINTMKHVYFEVISVTNLYNFNHFYNLYDMELLFLIETLNYYLINILNTYTVQKLQFLKIFILIKNFKQESN